MIAGFGLLLLVLLLLSGPRWSTTDTAAEVATLVSQLDAGAFAVSLLVAALCFVRWKLVGEAALLWLGTAAATYGLLTLGLGYVFALSLALENEGLLLLHPASRIVVIAIVVRALMTPEVDASLTPRRVVVTTLGSIALVSAILQVVPGARAAVMTASDALLYRDATIPEEASIVLVFAWLILAVWSMWLGLRRRHMLAWFGLLFFSQAFAELLSVVAVPEGSVWVAGPALLRVFGLLCAVVGATAELARAYVKQGSKLLESVNSGRTAEARIEAERVLQEERAHEARNALTAIEGATRTLQRYQDQLDDTSRAELAEAVSEEIRRLQQLVGNDPSTPPPGRFRLTEALAAVVTCVRSQGCSVTLDVPDHLVAVGHPAATAEVLQNLFQNAQRYAGGEVTVSATLEGEHVVIRVDDDGPGIAPGERDTVLARGIRGSNAADTTGSGLGLYICTQLMRQQGGTLSIDASPSGGASIIVSLPGFSELGSGVELAKQPFDAPDETGELPSGPEAAVLVFPGDRQRGPARVEDEDGVRHDLVR